MKRQYLQVPALLAFLIPNSVALPPQEPFISHSLIRQLELDGSVAKSQTTLSLEYTGSGYNDETLELHIPNELIKHQSWYEVQIGKAKPPLLTNIRLENFDSQSQTQILRVDLPQGSLTSGSNLTLIFNEAYTHLSTPKPRMLEQTNEDGQYMFWSGDLTGGFTTHRTFSEVKLRVKIPTPKVKTFSKPENFQSVHTTGSSTIIYTSESPVNGPVIGSVHYEQPEPVVTFRKLERSLLISHWASDLAVEDQITVVNDGPELKGHFARITHQLQSYLRKTSMAGHVLTGLVFSLPFDAHSPYVIDTVGNVSTTHFRPGSIRNARRQQFTNGIVEVRPRYPLMGGWKYDFSIGYHVPLQSFLRKTASGLYVLAVPFVTPLKDVAVDEVEVRIVLPEGATSIQVELPFPASIEHSTHYTYLDTAGHPTIILKKSACSDRHGQNVLITYRDAIIPFGDWSEKGNLVTFDTTQTLHPDRYCGKGALKTI